MPAYLFEGMDESGSEVKDQIEATDADDARRQLRDCGIFVTRLEQADTEAVVNEPRVKQRNSDTSDTTDRSSPKASRRVGQEAPPWVLPVVSAGFLIGGLFFLIYLGVRPVWLVRRASDWIETPCSVVSSKLREESSSGQPGSMRSSGPTYNVEIVYRYEFQGREYQANRYDFVNLFTPDRAKWDGIVKAHPPGRQTACFVNPVSPAEAVLVREWTSEMGVGWWFPIPFVLFGVLGLLFSTGILRFNRNRDSE